MIKYYTSRLIIFIPLIALIIAFTSGPSEGYSGSPLDGNDCTFCHTPGPATIVEDWISTSIPTIGYTPGQTYTVTLTAFGLSSDKYGFQITAETATAKTGSWIITDATRTKLVGSSVTHTSAGTVPNGSPNTWTIDWTAPASGTGPVTFYATVNNTNDDGSNQGDEIFRTWRSEPESTIGIAEMEAGTIGNIYPNPALDHISIELPLNAEVSLYTATGKLLQKSFSPSDIYQVNISGLDQGVYYLMINVEGHYTTQSFLKK